MVAVRALKRGQLFRDEVADGEGHNEAHGGGDQDGSERGLAHHERRDDGHARQGGADEEVKDQGQHGAAFASLVAAV